MQDSFGRTVDYLRVSVTDRCNFRCIYCMPETGYPVSPKEECLTLEEIARIIHIAADLGIQKVRLTGGEPLIRRDLPLLIQEIRKHPNIQDLSCTTNGYLLEQFATPLANAGLMRINISLDTLNEDSFSPIARRGNLQKVLSGIKAAQSAGLKPIKINCVLMKGVNDHEVVDFARWTLHEELHIRFIELMPIRWNLDETEPLEAMSEVPGNRKLFKLRIAEDTGMLNDLQLRKMVVPSDVAHKMIEKECGELQPFEIITNGPARTFRLKDALGTIGFISQVSNDMCSRCNRIRLTADGQLRPCLMSDGEVDIRTPMRLGAQDDELKKLIEYVVQHKPERHYLAEGQRVLGRGMSQIGG